MAQVQLIATLGATAAIDGVPLFASVKGVGDPITGIPATTTMDTDVATLVSDAGSPTQGHVNTLNTDWTAFKAALTTYTGGSLTGNVTVSWNGSVVTTRRQLKAALDAIMRSAESGMGGLTP